ASWSSGSAEALGSGAGTAAGGASMNPVIIAAIVVAVLVIAAVAIIVTRSRRSERLQRQFGPEYEHEVEQAKGDRGKAESALLKREKRVEQSDIHPLAP